MERKILQIIPATTKIYAVFSYKNRCLTVECPVIALVEQFSDTIKVHQVFPMCVFKGEQGYNFPHEKQPFIGFASDMLEVKELYETHKQKNK